MDKIRLHNTQDSGVVILSGTDDSGCMWSQSWIDYLAEQEDTECMICGHTINEGWMNLDCAGEDVYDWCVEIVEKEKQ